MANIASFLQIIREAIYGRDMRGAIADSIEAVNTDLNTTKTDTTIGLDNKLDIAQGIPNAGKSMVVNSTGDIVPIDLPLATQSAKGQMAASDKVKVDNLTNYANAFGDVVPHASDVQLELMGKNPTNGANLSLGTKLIPSATGTNAGVMSAADKEFLDSLEDQYFIERHGTRWAIGQADPVGERIWNSKGMVAEVGVDDLSRYPRVYGQSIQNGTPSPDAPVPVQSLGDGGGFDVFVHGKNLFTTSIMGTLPTGVVLLQNGFQITNFYERNIPFTWGRILKPNTTYTARRKFIGNKVTGQVQGRIVAVSTSVNFTIIETGEDSRTFTTPANMNAYTSLRMYGNDSEVVTYTDIQIEQGSTATNYFPFTGSLTPVTTQPLRSLPDGTADWVDWKTGMVRGNVGKGVLTSSVPVTIASATVATDFYYVYSTYFDSLISTTGDSLDKFMVNRFSKSITLAQNSNTSIDSFRIVNQATASRVRIMILKSRIDAMAGATLNDKWNDYVTANQIEFYFQLATPTETPITLHTITGLIVDEHITVSDPVGASKIVMQKAPNTVRNDFDNVYPWSHMRTAAIGISNGLPYVIAYEDEPMWAFVGVGAHYVVEIPKFYQAPRFVETSPGVNDGYEYMGVSAFRLPGWYLNPIFLDSNGVELDKVYVGKYTAGFDGTNLITVPGVAPEVNRTRAGFRTLAMAPVNGSTCQLIDLAYHDALSTLFTVEFATRNSQSVMSGAINLPIAGNYRPIINENGANRVILTNSQAANMVIGQSLSFGIANAASNPSIRFRRIVAIVDYDSANKAIYFDGAPANIDTTLYVDSSSWFTGVTDSVSSSSGSLISNAGKYPMMYRGIEAFYVGPGQFIDGLNVSGNQLWISSKPSDYADGVFDVPYQILNYTTLPTTNSETSYITNRGLDSNYPWAQLPTEIGGSSSTFYADTVGTSAGTNNVVVFGGSVYGGLSMGIWMFKLNIANTTSHIDNGARLMWK